MREGKNIGIFDVVEENSEQFQASYIGLEAIIVLDVIKHIRLLSVVENISG